MTDTPELQISSIAAAFDKEKHGQDPYLWFCLGKHDVTTPVIKEGGADGQPVSWGEPLSLQVGDLGDKDGSQLQVRAYDKKPLLPDSLLGRATVDLASLGGLGNSHVAGSGGGAPVKVQLLGKKGAFGGHVSFTLTATEGLSIPGGTKWGPQEPHHTHPSATSAGSGSRELDAGVGTAGYTGLGASAYPARDSGKDLNGEHLSDFRSQGDNKASSRAIAAGAAAAATSAATLGAVAADDSHPVVSGSSGAGYPSAAAAGSSSGAAATSGQEPASTGPAATAGFGGGGATAFPAEASGKVLGGEHLSDFEKQEHSTGPAATAGFGGGGATAFPAESSGKGLGGEHLSDFEKQEQGSGPVATAGFGGGGATAYPAESSGKGLRGEHLSDFEKQGQSSGPASTAGFGGGGATAYPAESSGKDLGGEHLSDFQGGTAAGTGTGAAATVGSRSGEGAGPLRISGIGGKLVREDDTLGHVTPYLVFEVGDEREHTGTLKAFKAMEPLSWDDTLEIDLLSARSDDVLKVTAYDKKMLLLPDSYLGEAAAPLSQLPRGSPVTLKLQSAKQLGTAAGEVSFTLQVGGGGGGGGGQAAGVGKGVENLSVGDQQQGA